MMHLIFDIETNGLLPDLDKVHCLAILDVKTGDVDTYSTPEGLKNGLARLHAADVIIGHNILAFDIPALEKVYGWKPRAGTVVRDTLVLTQLFWPNIADQDHSRARRGFPKNLIGRHSLKAWGHRLGNFKGEFTGPWDVCTPEMVDYMAQDARVTGTLWGLIEDEATKWGVPLCDDNPPPKKDCVALEHRVAAIALLVTEHGFRFNLPAAVELVEKLSARRQQLVEELTKTFPPKIIRTEFVPKVNNSRLGYVKGQPIIKEKVIPFNPGSRQQVAERLVEMGWKPAAYGKDGVPTVDDDILSELTFPEAKLLAEFFTVEKRLGQIATGKEAWFKHVRGDRIHGRINSVGAHTGRMTHSGPNMAQVPKVGTPYGEECRACFTADEGQVLVGCDADALELRDLAGYMALWDEGAYIETVLRGDKDAGTDMHSINMRLWQTIRQSVTRALAKVGFYAMIYGCGDPKLAESLGMSGSYRTLVTYGKRFRSAIMSGLPALGALTTAVIKTYTKRGYLIGLDGRRLYPRSDNAALNTLLQSAGAVQMKRALVILYDNALAQGWKWGRDFAIVGIIHDEWQSTVAKAIAQAFGTIAADAIRQAGEFYSFGCPLAGNFDIGSNWKETH